VRHRGVCGAADNGAVASTQAMDDVRRANMRFQKEQMQKKIAEMKRKKAGGARKKVELTAEQRQERLRRKKASARKNKRR